MKIVAADDEPLMLENLIFCINKAEPKAEVVGFLKSGEIIEYAKANSVDVFFLDIKMGGKSGVDLAKEIKLNQPRTNIIFATGYSEYMPDAFLLNVSGYLLKPITVDSVKEQLEILRFPVKTEIKSKIYAQCFGNFEVFLDNEPIKFKHKKTKELFAYLISKRGVSCTSSEIMVALWEDENHHSYFRDLKKDLIDSFNKIGFPEIIVSGRGILGINKGMIDCDYYQWLDGTAQGINAYKGEFMYQYSWAEFTNASLQNSASTFYRHTIF